jgi:hypothetical protein
MILLMLRHVLQAKQICCAACSAIPEEMHNLLVCGFAQKSHDFDYAHDSACSAGKTMLVSCMFCNTRANAQSCFLWLAQKSQDLILLVISGCSAGKQLFAFEIWQIWAIFSMENPCIFSLKFGKILPKNMYIADAVHTLGHKSLFGAFTQAKCQAKWSEEEKAPP